MWKPVLFLFLLAGINNTKAQLKDIASGVYAWDKSPVKKDGPRTGRKILEGFTPEFSWLEIHATTQEKGATPRPPHIQDSTEELIIIKEGKLKCMIGRQTSTLGAGSVLLIPPGESQSFENAGEGPVTYYVLMFRSRLPMDPERSRKAGGILMINADTLKYTEKNERGTEKYFDRPTATTANYEMHTTTLLKKGPSHAPHSHTDTEIILVTKGEVEMTINGNYYKGSAGDLFIAHSGEMHGVGNASDAPCKYFAFKWR